MMSHEETGHAAPTFLGKHEYERLREAIHTSQLSLLHEVLIRSLKVLHEFLRQIPAEGGETGVSFFDEKINALCTAFRKLRALPDLYSKESEQARNIAVTAFVFYRILYRGVFEALVTQIPSTTEGLEADPAMLWKRIPYKLYDFLGGQFWRIYEFHHLVAGDVSTLQLNSDLIPWIESTEVKKANSVSVKTQDPIAELKEWLQKQLNESRLRVNENGIYSAKMRYPNALFINQKLLNDYLRGHPAVHDLQDLLRAQQCQARYVMREDKAMNPVFRIDGLKVIFDEYHPQEIEEVL